MRTVPVLLLTAATIAAAASDRPRTSERYAYSTFRERAGRVGVFVDGYPASLHATDRYVPIPIAVAVYESGRSIPVSPETFTLLDAGGQAVHAASYSELVDRYGKVEFDQALLRQTPIVIGSYTSDLFPIRGTFYPAPSGGTRAMHVEVPPFSVFSGVLYFPVPPGGLKGVLTLRMTLPEGESIDVGFVADFQARTEAPLDRG